MPGGLKVLCALERESRVQSFPMSTELSLQSTSLFLIVTRPFPRVSSRSYTRKLKETPESAGWTQRSATPLHPSIPLNKQSSTIPVSPCYVYNGCWHAQAHTNLEGEHNRLFSNRLNVTDTATNKRVSYNAPMGVPASFS